MERKNNIENKRILVIADVPNWAFDKIYKGLKKYCQHWNVDVRYGGSKENLDIYPYYDLVFYLLDFNPSAIYKSDIPKEKLIMGIRSNVLNNKSIDFYQDIPNLNKRIGAFLTANKKLKSQFDPLHDLVRVAPGGTDTEIFTFSDYQINNPLRVGWAGSKRNFGYKFRGLDILEQACNSTGMIFNPAYREDKWRSETEMVQYYQDDIDIYVDLSESAGRQNGLIEAGSCGKAIISSNAGIAEQLIQHGVNGYLVERELGSVIKALVNIRPNIERFGKNIRKTIEKSWSWKTQSLLFEQIFDEVLDTYKSQTKE